MNDSACDLRTRRVAVSEEHGWRQRFELRLIVHLVDCTLAPTHEREKRKRAEQRSHEGTS